MKIQTFVAIAAFVAASVISSQASANSACTAMCDAEFKYCLSYGGVSKTTCLNEFSACKAECGS